MLTHDQLSANINAMEKQGAKPDEVQQYLNSLKDTSKTGAPTKASLYNIPHIEGRGPAVTAANAGIGTANVAKNVAGGFASGVMQTGFNLADLATKGVAKVAGAAGFPGAQKTMENFAASREQAAPIEKTFSGINSTLSGKVGEGLGEVAQFAAPGGVITKGQDIAMAGVDAAKLGGKALPWIAQKLAQVVPEAAVTGGVQYGKSGGDTKSAANAALGAGIFSTLSHVGADAFRKLVPQSVKDNVSGFLKFTGKQSLGNVATGKKVDDAVSAFTTMVRNAPQIKVTTADGVEKVFDPRNTSLYEAPQVLYQTKNLVYKMYTDIAKKAGGEGVNFGQADFGKIIDKLKSYAGKGSDAAQEAKANTFIDLLQRYGKKNPTNPADPTLYYKNVTPEDVQKIIENVNLHVNPMSDKPGTKVANQLSIDIRDMLDKKIESATGAEYQKARTAYSQLKTVEKDIVDQAKVALRKGSTLPSDFIDGLAGVDILQSILTANPAMAARGLSIAGVKAAFRYLRSPEVKMKAAFKILQDGEEGGAPQQSTTAKRLFGAPVQAPKAIKAAALAPAAVAAATQ